MRHETILCGRITGTHGTTNNWYECNWEGAYSNKRNNLKCTILDAWYLGYQCSEKNLRVLRKWFKNDPEVFKELETNHCPTTPDRTTSQDTYEEITITTQENQITVNFKASGVNMGESDSWTWTETDFFELDQDHIQLVKKEKSKLVHQSLDE